jgi:GNAT superfamily N-acetyltransferase
MIVELAVYENEPEAVTGTVAMLRSSLFGDEVHAEALVAEIGGSVVGYAIYHGSYSTWLCTPGVWLEDFYVKPSHRRDGVGIRLFRAVAAVTVEKGCTRLAWSALDWKETAISFYDKLGSEVLDAWTTRRLSGEAIRAVAEG